MNPLVLIPTVIGQAAPQEVLPGDFLKQIDSIRTFVVEELRTARRFLRAIGYRHDFKDVTFYCLNEHTSLEEAEHFLNTIESGPIGLLSEAGVPCVADPGAWIVAMAHRRQIPVKPLVGPCSILMALMASGLNGQCFAFNGYLPVKSPQREHAIKEMEQRMGRYNQTQIFIEAPYRNQALFEAFLNTCQARTQLAVAVELSQPDALIACHSIAQWPKHKVDLHKKNTVFLIGNSLI